MLHKGKLFHQRPPWVTDAAFFHIRLRILDSCPHCLTDSTLAQALLSAAQNYQQRGRWYGQLLLLMPDHLHAVLAFPAQASMSAVIGAWKSYLAKTQRIAWQGNYFDHRLRNAAEQLEKMHYIRMNPVRAGLCAQPADWPWVLGPADFQGTS